MPNHIKEKTGDIKTILTVGVMLSGAFIAMLNQTILSPALPSIMENLDITAIEGQWLTTAFMLVSGIMIPITAYLIARLTTRQLFLASMLFFTVGTVISAFAASFAILLAGRILQAMASGVVMPMTQTVIILLYPKEKRGSAMGMAGIVIAFAPAIGPTLSGWVVDSWGWNRIFLIIVPLAIMDIVMGFIFLKNVGEVSKLKLDITSVVYSTLGFGGLLYGCSIAGSYGWVHWITVSALGVGIAFLTMFIHRQLHLETPMLELRVLKTMIFSYATIIGMIINAALVTGLVITPIYLQNILHFTALQSGLVMMPGAVLMGIMSPITGNLFDRFGPRGIIITGIAIMTAFSGFFVIMDETWEFWFLCVIYTIRMFGMALVNMPLAAWGLNALDNEMIAHGNAINNTARQVAGSIGTAVLITVMAMVSGFNRNAGEIHATLSGMHAAFGVATGLSLIALVMAIICIKRQRPLDAICATK